MRLSACWALLAVILLGACTDDPPEQKKPSSPTAKYADTQAGAEALARDLRTATDPALIRSLEPTTADYRALFDDGFAAKAESYYKGWIWTDTLPAALDVKPDQTEVTLWRAKSDDIKAWTPEVQANFPGGYERVGPHLKPGVTICKWDYTRPGEDLGKAYNGLAFVKGHWKFFPKPWQVLE